MTIWRRETPVWGNLAKYFILSKSCGENWDISLEMKKEERERKRVRN
eukprot:jgi/Antlo1/987/154